MKKCLLLKKFVVCLRSNQKQNQKLNQMEAIKENTTIKAGNHLISIGRTAQFVAILSPTTFQFVELAKSKTNKRLRKAKREFKAFLNSGDTFTFEHFSNEQTLRLIEILKGK